jgi:phosphoribosylanthranilate isomerase
VAASLEPDPAGEEPLESAHVASGTPVPEAVRILEAAGISLLVHADRARDGSMRGPNLEALRDLVAMTSLPVVAAGGVSSLSDLRAVAELSARGVAGAVLGRAVYERKFTIGDANSTADEASSKAHAQEHAEFE